MQVRPGRHHSTKSWEPHWDNIYQEVVPLVFLPKTADLLKESQRRVLKTLVLSVCFRSLSCWNVNLHPIVSDHMHPWAGFFFTNHLVSGCIHSSHCSDHSSWVPAIENLPRCHEAATTMLHHGEDNQLQGCTSTRLTPKQWNCCVIRPENLFPFKCHVANSKQAVI